MFKGSRKPQ